MIPFVPFGTRAVIPSASSSPVVDEPTFPVNVTPPEQFVPEHDHPEPDVACDGTFVNVTPGNTPVFVSSGNPHKCGAGAQFNDWPPDGTVVVVVAGNDVELVLVDVVAVDVVVALVVVVVDADVVVVGGTVGAGTVVVFGTVVVRRRRRIRRRYERPCRRSSSTTCSSGPGSTASSSSSSGRSLSSAPVSGPFTTAVV